MDTFNSAPFPIQKNTFSETTLRKVVSIYASVCGISSLCNTHYLNESNVYTNGISHDYCQACSCSPSCFISDSTDSCCFDHQLDIMPRSCVADDRLPVIIQGNYITTRELSDDRIFSVIDTCLLSNAQPEDKMNCEKSTNQTMIHRIPVVSPLHKGIAYNNIFCALCNGETLDELNIYIDISCKTLLETYTFQKIDKIWKAASAQRCRVKITLPDDGRVRLCNVNNQSSAMSTSDNVFSTCNITNNWREFDQDVVDLCENDTKYPEIMMDTITTNISAVVKFKNVFCFQCNPLSMPSESTDVIDTCSPSRATNISSSACGLSPAVELWWPYKNVYCYYCNVYRQITKRGGPDDDGIYRRLFSMSRKELELFQQERSHSCINGSYDHFQEMCRQLYCSGDRILENATCIHIFQTTYDYNDAYSLTIKLQAYPEYIGETLNVFTLCQAVLDGIQQIIRTQGHICSVTTVFRNTSVSNKNGTLCTESIIYLTFETKIFVYIEFKIISTRNKTVMENSIINLKRKDYAILSNSSRHIIMTPVASILHTLSKDDVCTYEVSHEQNITWTIVTELTFSLACPLLQLEPNEYTIGKADDGTKILTLLHNDVLDNDYVLITTTISGDRVRICEDYYMKYISHSYIGKGDQLATAYYIFSHACVGLSEIGLLFTLVAYGLLPPLRTLPGRNNMCLALSLLLAQLSIQVGPTFPRQTPLCRISGVIIHYFWMSTFCFMNICSYHMYRVFVARYLMVHNNSLSYLFRMYILYSYGVPALLVLAVIAYQSIATNGMDIGYGNVVCFIDDLYWLILTFITPSVIIFSSNILFYAATFYKIKTISSMQTNVLDRRDVFIYARLCSLTGVAWPLQIVDAAFGLTVFSFIITFINASQGMLIFVSFVCNKRVIRLLKQRFHLAEGQSWFSKTIETIASEKIRK